MTFTGREQHILSDVRGWLMRTDEHSDIEVLDVRLATDASGTTVQVLYRDPPIGPCLYGWSYEYPWPPSQPNLNPGWIFDAFREQNEAAGWGPPEACDPDGEGVTWWFDPYEGRSLPDWRFEDHVECVLRSYEPDARPASRSDVERLLSAGVSSVEELRSVAARSGPDQAAAAWLARELADL